MYEDTENKIGNVEKILHMKNRRSDVWNHFVDENKQMIYIKQSL